MLIRSTLKVLYVTFFIKWILFLLPVCEGVVITHYIDPLFVFCYYLWRPVILFLCEVSGSDFLRNPPDVTCMRAPEPTVYCNCTAANDMESDNTKKRIYIYICWSSSGQTSIGSTQDENTDQHRQSVWIVERPPFWNSKVKYNIHKTWNEYKRLFHDNKKQVL